MSSKYKYLFKFGRGSSATELLGPSIAYFWNDIYDIFDIERKMIVERLNGKEFSIAEIKRIFGMKRIKGNIPSAKVARYLDR